MNSPHTVDDKELLQQIRKVFRTRIHKFDTKTVTIEQTPETRNKQFIIAPYDMTAEKLLNLIHQYGDRRELEGRIDEHAKWKVVAEEIVEKDGVYRGVNYLNKRSTELHDQLNKQKEGK